MPPRVKGMNGGFAVLGLKVMLLLEEPVICGVVSKLGIVHNRSPGVPCATLTIFAFDNEVRPVRGRTPLLRECKSAGLAGVEGYLKNCETSS
jgi:hypothetical protein